MNFHLFIEVKKRGGGALVHVYVLEHIVSLNYRIAWWIFTKLGRDKVLMTPYICIDSWAKSAQGWIQGSDWEEVLAKWAIFSFFSMILKFSMGHFLSFYTDFNGPFFKLMGLWRMAPCLPNHCQGGAKIGPGGSLLQRTSSSDRKATATYWMHSSDLEAFGKKYCYFWFHWEVKFLTRFGRFFGLSHFGVF